MEQSADRNFTPCCATRTNSERKQMKLRRALEDERTETERCPNRISFVPFCFSFSRLVLLWKMILSARCPLDGVSLPNTLLVLNWFDGLEVWLQSAD